MWCFCSECSAKYQNPSVLFLLFICNVAQIVFMFATWYHLLGGHSLTDALLKSILAFATIGYAENMPKLAMLQIATDFLLLAIFLSHLVGQFGQRGRNPPKDDDKPQQPCTHHL